MNARLVYFSTRYMGWFKTCSLTVAVCEIDGIIGFSDITWFEGEACYETKKVNARKRKINLVFWAFIFREIVCGSDATELINVWVKSWQILAWYTFEECKNAGIWFIINCQYWKRKGCVWKPLNIRANWNLVRWLIWIEMKLWNLFEKSVAI